jgi:hypothetical protein
VFAINSRVAAAVFLARAWFYLQRISRLTAWCRLLPALHRAPRDAPAPVSRILIPLCLHRRFSRLQVLGDQKSNAGRRPQTASAPRLWNRPLGSSPVIVGPSGIHNAALMAPWDGGGDTSAVSVLALLVRGASPHGTRTGH